MNLAARIDADSPCVRCGYNLREMGSGDACPECGLCVERSLALGQKLQDSRPAWIRSLAWGSGLLLMAHLMLPVAWVASVIGPQYANQLVMQTNSWIWYSLGDLPGSLACLLAAILHWFGCWLLTRRENPHARVQPSAGLSLALRLCAMAPLIWGLMLVAGDLLDYQWQASSGGRGMGTPRWYHELKDGSLWVLVLYVPCPLLQLILLRRLAVRVLNRRLLEHVTIVGIGYPLSTLLLVAVVFVWSYSGAFSVLNSTAGYILLLLVFVATGLFGLWAMYLYGMCMSAFSRAARQARAAWLAADRSVEGAK